MSLATLGFVTIGLFLVLTLATRLPVIAALVLVPLAAGVAGGFGAEIGAFALDGVKTVAPVTAMIFFALLYFGLMLDQGLFEPMIRKVLSLVGEDPLRLCLASAVLPMLVALDGDGATTFLISVTALLPVHRRLGLNPLILPCLVALSAGVMNMLPWGGPTARAMAVLKSDVSGIFTPVVPAMAAGLGWVLFVAWWMGRGERRRLAAAHPAPGGIVPDPETRPSSWRFWFNLGLTLIVIVLLFRDLYAGLIQLPPLPPALVFMAAFAIALPVNCQGAESQARQLASHAASVASVTTMILAAGVFTGVLNGSGMTKAMAEMLAAAAPGSLAPWFSTIVALTAMPMSFVLPPDAYYFGVLPVFAETAGTLGQNPLEIGRGAILGQMTTGFPLSPLTASTFILIGLSGVSLRDHQRFAFKWAFGSTIVMTVTALLTGAI
ncbi:CitMHS family transporter [Novosphingobium sp.]|uniref:CitMHS family transporter n=1 Tax=Novosphingobium sp. TaxID=1874826 RepID=UPI0035B287D2